MSISYYNYMYLLVKGGVRIQEVESRIQITELGFDRVILLCS